jgi:hypothetical protein
LSLFFSTHSSVQKNNKTTIAPDLWAAHFLILVTSSFNPQSPPFSFFPRLRVFLSAVFLPRVLWSL